jgi:hypothetical protein
MFRNGSEFSSMDPNFHSENPDPRVVRAGISPPPEALGKMPTCGVDVPIFQMKEPPAHADARKPHAKTPGQR